MASVLIVRHTPENHIGAFSSVLDALGLTYHYIEAYLPKYQELSAFEQDLNQYRPNGIVVLGGPQHAMDDELVAERAWLKQLLETNVPIFAICLGSQMLAAILGGTVSKNRYQEVGWVEIIPTDEGLQDPVFGNFTNSVNHRQFHWHNDSFTLPPGAVALATSKTCPQQAFRYGENVLAVQFHPEVAMDVIEGWLVESKTMAVQQKAELKEESVQALDPLRTDSSICSSLSLFQAFCRQYLL